MKKEDADQLIRCVKECWWRVAALLSLLFAGVFVAVSGRPVGGWGLDWTAVGALATFSAAYVALHVASKERREREKLALTEAHCYLPKLCSLVSKACVIASRPKELKFSMEDEFRQRVDCLYELSFDVDLFKVRLINHSLFEHLREVKLILVVLKNHQLIEISTRNKNGTQMVDRLLECLYESHCFILETKESS